MKLRKIMALALVTTMILSLAGCGAKSDTTDSAESTETVQEETTETATEEADVAVETTEATEE